MSDDQTKQQAHCCVPAEYFTVQELAKYSRIGEKTLYEAIRKRELKHFSVGRKSVISKKDFEIWFEKNAKDPIPEPSLAAIRRNRKSVFFAE